MFKNALDALPRFDSVIVCPRSHAIWKRIGRGRFVSLNSFFEGNRLCTGLKSSGRRNDRFVDRLPACVFEFGTGNNLSPAGALEFAPDARARAANSLRIDVQDARDNVRIDVMSPASGPVGTEVVLTGFGFTDDNTIHFGAGVVAHVSIRSAIGISCTTNPSCRGGIRQSLVFTVPDALPGANHVWVENGNGIAEVRDSTSQAVGARIDANSEDGVYD